MSATHSARRCVSPVVIAVLVAAVACGDPYVRTNPYDNLVPVTITISGPDTIYNYRQQGHFAATSVPAFPDSAFQFSSSDTFSFAPAGPGNWIAIGTPLYPKVGAVTLFAGVGAIDTQPRDAGNVSGPAPHVTAWRHQTSKIVYLTQRVVRILLRCPDVHSCDPVSAGSTWSVWVDGFDATNQKIASLFSATANPATGTAIATFASRDSTIATVVPVGIRAATVTARKSGATWIVATRDTLRDSLKLVVR
jgi:hypothetical protein